jgi:hypothetical protein
MEGAAKMEADRFLAGARFFFGAGGESPPPRFLGASLLNPLSHNSSMSLKFVAMSDGTRSAPVPAELLTDKKFISRMLAKGCILEEDENTDEVWVRELPRQKKHPALKFIDFFITIVAVSIFFLAGSAISK